MGQAQLTGGKGVCVVLAVDGDVILLRDSKDPSIHRRYTFAEIAAFLGGAKNS